MPSPPARPPTSRVDDSQDPSRCRRSRPITSPAPKTAAEKYLYGKDAEKALTVPEGYKVELFASREGVPQPRQSDAAVLRRQRPPLGRGHAHLSALPSRRRRCRTTSSSFTRTPTATAKPTRKPSSRTSCTCPSASSSPRKAFMFPRSPISCCCATPTATTRPTAGNRPRWLRHP